MVRKKVKGRTRQQGRAEKNPTQNIPAPKKKHQQGCSPEHGQSKPRNLTNSNWLVLEGPPGQPAPALQIKSRDPWHVHPRRKVAGGRVDHNEHDKNYENLAKEKKRKDCPGDETGKMKKVSLK